MRITVKVSAVPRVDMVRFPLPKADATTLTKDGTEIIDANKVAEALNVPGVMISNRDNGGVIVLGAEILRQAESMYSRYRGGQADYGPKGSAVETKMDKGEAVFIRIDIGWLASKGKYRARIEVGNPRGVKNAYALKAAAVCAETFASIIIHISRSLTKVKDAIIFEDDQGHFARAAEFMDRAKAAEEEEASHV